MGQGHIQGGGGFLLKAGHDQVTRMGNEECDKISFAMWYQGWGDCQ